MNLNKKGAEVNNCLNCGSQYENYKIGDKNSEIFGWWCELSLYENNIRKEPKGLCQFCNPKSIYFNKK